MLLVVSKQALMIIYCIMWTMAWTERHCINYDINKTIVNYRCPDDFETVRVTHVSRHVCRLYCTAKVQCRMLSFDEKNHSCLIYKEVCVEIIKYLGFSSLLLQDVTKRACISWIPYEGIIPLDERIIHRGDGAHFLVRFHYDGELLPGRLYVKRAQKQVRVVKHKTELLKVTKEATSDVEFLVVSETCSVAWVPYTAGRDMPLRVVTGGRKWNGQALLLAVLWTTAGPIHNYRFGHYDADDKMSYTYNKGVRSNASVDLLIEIWSRFRYVQMFLRYRKLNVITVIMHSIVVVCNAYACTLASSLAHAQMQIWVSLNEEIQREIMYDYSHIHTRRLHKDLRYIYINICGKF